MVGDLLVRLFTNAGHTVEHFADGLEAWRRISEDVNAFDVVVTDQQMPGLRGDELVELLRDADFAGRIIVHAATLTAPERDRFLAFQVDRIVQKSSQAEELLAIVEAFHES